MADEGYEDWIQDRFNDLDELVEKIAARMLENGDDRVTILGMLQSAVLHGLHDAGFTDETT